MSDVKIIIETNDKELSAALKRVKKSFDDVKGAGVKASSDVKKGQEGVNKALGQGITTGKLFGATLASSLASQAIMGGLRMLTNAVRGLGKTFISDGIKAAQEYEASLNLLNQALKSTGEFSLSASKDMEDFAAEMQRTTAFADNAILSNAALIQSIGGLTKDGLKEATKAAADMSVALGVDLRTAANLVGRAATGEIGTLSRYGLVVERGANAAETFSNVLDVLNTKFGGSAEAELNTFQGQVKKLKNEFDDLVKVIGFAIIRNESVVKGFQAAGKVVAFVTTQLTDNAQLYKDIGSAAVQATVILASFGATTLALSGGFGALAVAAKAAWIAVTGPVGIAVAAFIGLSAAIFAIKRNWDEVVNVTRLAIAEALELAAVGLSAVSRRQAAALREKADAYRELVTASREAKNAQLEELEAAKAAAEGANEQLTAAQLRAAEEQAIQEKANREKLLAEQDFQIKLQEIKDGQALVAQEERLITEQEADAQSGQLALLRKADQLAMERELARESWAEEVGDKQKIDEIRAQNELAQSQRRLAITKAESDARKKQEEEDAKNRLAIQQRFDSDMRVLMTSRNKGLFKMGQAYAITQATMNAYEAASKANAQGGILGPVFAAAALAAGMVQVQRISSQKPPAFQDGGIVPGSSFVGDKVDARVNSGEMILNQRQQAKLFNMANGGGGGGEIVVHTNVNLDGEIVARAVSRRVADGMVLGEAV